MDDVINYKGQTIRTGCLVPAVNTSSLPLLSSAPGFRTWTRNEIEEAIKKKPYKRRDFFKADQGWILNQANRGSCNCAAATGALRRVMVLGGRNEVPQLSWEFLYAQLVDGDDRGSMLDDGMVALGKTGIPPLDLTRHPLNKHIRKRDYSPEDYAQAQGFMAEQCYQVDDPLEMATLLLSGQGAGVVAVHVGNNFVNLDKNGYAGVDRGPGNHAVCVDDVEIINGKLAFDHAGSWGPGMHADGRAYFDWDAHLKGPNQYHKFYAIVGATNPGTK